ncbi:snoRNA-binding rRNA-processing protein imp4 [Perkinsus chesapeaki]|uniref:SnoRNA-binding rRNA-processing protein imp4 n=1 Tax=Perkinsus chesapeaki TaxID=330153 RepID=A0A7J6LW50_PERCH|nr:snoRNA-binding rRNA-processing protein imp4 [Perkinsus chesapeaki]
MLRRNVRLRKEYLYKKALEEKERTTLDKKRKLREALEQNKAVPTELRGDTKLRTTLDLEDDRTKVQRLAIDDEYQYLGVREPRVLVTTSRNPSSRLGKFVKEVRLLIPNSQRINRGTYVMKDLVDLCRKNDITDMVIVHEHRGQPDGLIVSHLPYGPTAYFGLTDVVLRHDLPEKPPNMPETYPHLIFHDFGGNIGTRVQTILSALFPPSKPDSTRTITFANDGGDCIGFRHHTFEKPTKAMKNRGDVKPEDIKLFEQGPRFNMHLYRLELGTLDMPDVKTEWVLRPHFNKQKSVLAGQAILEDREGIDHQHHRQPSDELMMMADVLVNNNVADDCHIDLGPLFPTQSSSSDGPEMESPLSVPLFPNPNLLDNSGTFVPSLSLVTAPVDNNRLGGSSSTSPRSAGSCSSSGGGGSSPSKTKRAIRNKGKCAYPLGCNKYRQNGTRFCVKHGGVRRCAVAGCPNAAKRGDNSRAVFCIRHGGGKSCRVPGCGVSARGSTGYCYKHRKLAESRPRKDSAASTVSGSSSELSQCDQSSLQLGTIEVPSLALNAGESMDFSDAMVTAAAEAAAAAAAGSAPESPQWSSFANSWNGYPTAGGIPSLAASMNFMDLSDEKWTDFLKPMEPLPELLTNHINPNSSSDATEQLQLF